MAGDMQYTHLFFNEHTACSRTMQICHHTISTMAHLTLLFRIKGTHTVLHKSDEMWLTLFVHFSEAVAILQAKPTGGMA